MAVKGLGGNQDSNSFSISEMRNILYFLIFCTLVIHLPLNFLSADPITTEGTTQQSDPFLAFEDSNPDTLEDNEKKAPAQAERKVPFPGYGPYRDLFEESCKWILIDGRSQPMQIALQRLTVERADCKPCRLLYKQLLCKASLRQPESEKKALSPSTELIAAISNIFSDIATNKDLAPGTADALNPLLEALSAKSDPQSNEYFDTLITYVRAPLLSEFKESNKNSEKLKSKVKEKQLDALF